MKQRIEKLEKEINRKMGKSKYPPPGFFKEGDPKADTYHEELLKQGYSLEAVRKTPIFIDDL